MSGRRARSPRGRHVKAQEPDRAEQRLREQPFAIAPHGQVHCARTCDGEHVAVNVRHRDIVNEITSDLRPFAGVSPIAWRLASGCDAGALLERGARADRR
jgi:predicted unusual protein kinase regulating ubiquinone biosynthesis (AarF/ABC1/UbiB family)